MTNCHCALLSGLGTQEQRVGPATPQAGCATLGNYLTSLNLSFHLCKRRRITAKIKVTIVEKLFEKH